MDRLEMLIDNLIIYLPSDIPFLLSLIQQPNGRYIVFGLAVVLVFLLIWLLLVFLQLIFFGQRHQKTVDDKTPPTELTEHAEADSDAETDTTDGFSFFRKVPDAVAGDLDENPELVAIEQEMLALRSLYTDRQIIRDVYVSETQRLYAKAQTVKNGGSE